MASSRSRRSPKIAAASIPNITALRAELDYGDPRLERCAKFNANILNFRCQFRTSGGVRGVDLYDWKSRDGQAGLNEMTLTYLEKEGSGLMFWPDDRSSPNYNKYQYSKDGQQIKRLVKQLFFKVNQQQFRNHKYKHKEPAEAKAINHTGHSEHPFDIDAIALSPGTELANKPSLVADKSATPDQPDLDQYLDEPPPSPSRVILNNTDTFDVPATTPTSPTQFQSINQPLRTAKRGLNYADTTLKGQQAKRQKMEDDFDPTMAFREPNTDTRPLPQPTPVPAIRAQASPAPESAAAPTSCTLHNHTWPAATRPDEPDQPQDQTRHPISNTDIKSPTPDNSIAKLPAAALVETPSTTASAPTASATKPSVNFFYRVVLARRPKTVTERWTPRGWFQDKRLAELLKELPFGHNLLTPRDNPQAWGLIFTIDSECLRTVERIEYGDENGFQSMKRHIMWQIREWFAQRRRRMQQAGTLNVDVLIGLMRGDEEDEEVKGGVGDLFEDFKIEW